MKKMLAFLLAAMMVFSLVACSGDSGSGSGSSTSTTPSTSTNTPSTSGSGSTPADTGAFKPSNKTLNLIVPYSAGGAGEHQRGVVSDVAGTGAAQRDLVGLGVLNEILQGLETAVIGADGNEALVTDHHGNHGHVLGAVIGDGFVRGGQAGD